MLRTPCRQYLRPSAPATVSITVTAVNDAPKLESIEAGALIYNENDAATPITARAALGGTLR